MYNFDLISGQERKFAYRTDGNPENEDVAYDESEDDVRARGDKAWVLGEIENYRKRLQSENDDGN